MKNYDEIKSCLIAAVRSVQEWGGYSTEGIDGSTCPMADLPGFDSLNAVEVASVLTGNFGQDIAMDVSLFQSGNQFYSIDEATKKLYEYLNQDQEE